MNKRSILIIDEDKHIRETLSDILGDEGHKIFTAASGEKALKLLDSESIDLVLTEIWIPDLDGFSIFREIKKMKGDLPVIMMSGHANCDTAFQAGKMGVYEFLEKPVSLDKLLIMIMRAKD